jgi:hypothetical protein
MAFRHDKLFLCIILYRCFGHDTLLVLDGYNHSGNVSMMSVCLFSSLFLAASKLVQRAFYQGIYWRHSFGHYTMALSDWVLDRHEYERRIGKGYFILGYLHLE